MIEIIPQENLNALVHVGGSKSYTHRIFIAAALSKGLCSIKNALRSEDTDLTLEGLKSMGVEISETQEEILVKGNGGKLKASKEIFLANSGTGMRLLTAVAALAEGKTVLTGNERMRQRPISDLINGLKQMGIAVKSLEGTGCPPVEVIGSALQGGIATLRGDTSSQYLSALLLISPFAKSRVLIKVVGDLVSKPYVDLTLEVMERLGVKVYRKGYKEFQVPGGQVYRAGDYYVEPDVSNAAYFWAAAAVAGGSVTVVGINTSSRQGDLKILHCLEKMGCRVTSEKGGITVTREGFLQGIEVDMQNMPDVAPTLAVIAAFARGTTVIRNVSHLRVKECDRGEAVCSELRKMGIDAHFNGENLTVTGGTPRGAEIETYKDHRIAMSFSIAGLKTPGVKILDEACVVKSFPDYWQVFRSLYK